MLQVNDQAGNGKAIQRGEGESAERSAAKPAVPVHEAVAQLHAGQISPDEITTEDRRTYVDELVHMGYSSTNIAEALRVSARTIERDRQALREQQAVRSGPELAGRIVGQLQRYTEASAERLTRLANDTNIAPFARLNAEDILLRNLTRFVNTVHKLEFLPKGNKYGQPTPEEHEQQKLLDAFFQERKHQALGISMDRLAMANIERNMQAIKAAAAAERAGRESNVPKKPATQQPTTSSKPPAPANPELSQLDRVVMGLK